MVWPLQYRTPSAKLTVRRVSAGTYAENGGASVVPNAGTCSGQRPPHLLPKHFFDLPGLFLNFTGVWVRFAFSLLGQICRYFSRLFFDFAFHFMKLAFNLILRTRF